MQATDLSWLEEPPADFRLRVRELSAGTGNSEADAQRLARCRLSGNQLHTLSNAIVQLSEKSTNRTRLGVLSNGTADLLLPALAVSALRHGVWANVIGSAFDQVAAEALNPDSQINRARCDFVLLCVDHRGLPLTPTLGNVHRASETVQAALQYIDTARFALRRASGCTVVVQTVPQVPGCLFGNIDRRVPGTLQWLIDRYNAELRERVGNSSDLLLDAAALAEVVGLNDWHDAVQWNLGKFPFAHAVMPLYADWIGRLLGAARGKARKCLVLDLDNTIWGGVIGDDGIAGIVLGNGSPAGEAHLSVQRTALQLRERGIVLAVSSKNDEEVARNAFRLHPEMLLKEEHIAVFQANWRDKAANLRAIAETLNIGVDALVLLDDNPAERAQVRQALPAVAVPELPDDPALFSATLLAAGYFEATHFTIEDMSRADQYRQNAVRAELLSNASDMDSYLNSLAMRAICKPFDPIGRARITQLINKSNQFNLTTRRYTEADVERFETSGSGLTLQLRLLDRFGDNGMIAVVICTEQDVDWVIDTWLMSCRVLNRGVEQATLNYIVARARKAGVRALIGQYFKTDRNGMVKDHYAKLGFAPVSSDEEASQWQLDVASYTPVQVRMEVIENESNVGLEPMVA